MEEGVERFTKCISWRERVKSFERLFCMWLTYPVSLSRPHRVPVSQVSEVNTPGGILQFGVYIFIMSIQFDTLFGEKKNIRMCSIQSVLVGQMFRHETFNHFVVLSFFPSKNV